MKTEVSNKEYLINKELEKKYLFFPFEVPENVQRMEVEYDYPRFEFVRQGEDAKKIEVNIVDLGLHDQNGEFRGASGSNKKSFFIEENSSTPGYINGEICPGTWNIMFGAYKVREGGCKVSLRVTFYLKERILLRGDFHMHTQISDGDYSVRDLIHLAKMMKLDFIFLTDHNNFHQNEFILPNDELVVLPGMELTLYDGHCNFLGIKKPITSFFVNSKEEVIDVMNEARRNGAIIEINHPNDDCPWLWGYDVPFDILEIQNAFFDEKIDTQTIDLWQGWLCEGKRIPIVGGSDAHAIRFMESIGSPCTFLYADSNGKGDILKAIRNGNAFVSCFITGPTISLSIGDYIMGGIVPSSCRDKIKIELNQKSLQKKEVFMKW